MMTGKWTRPLPLTRPRVAPLGRLGRPPTLARRRPLPSFLQTLPPLETAAGKPARRQGRWRRGLPLLPRVEGMVCRGGGPGQGGQRCSLRRTAAAGARLGSSACLGGEAPVDGARGGRISSVGPPPDLIRPAPTPPSSPSPVRSQLRCDSARRIRRLAVFWRWGSWDRGKPLAAGGGHNDDDAAASNYFLEASLRYPTPHQSAPASR
ncbi:unnamed protein product [Triticum turgidum subsp. durum]|uniref:Uncharacterized protein n=1 Tax=Triticum turgidum subsp. durum TaxID=4567 RepID=A0A9R1NXB4_TRITD|nr:unnamed protein product [Triticum turgidum subsp. durum]